jgi:hypothetical protein
MKDLAVTSEETLEESRIIDILRSLVPEDHILNVLSCPGTLLALVSERLWGNAWVDDGCEHVDVPYAFHGPFLSFLVGVYNVTDQVPCNPPNSLRLALVLSFVIVMCRNCS